MSDKFNIKMTETLTGTEDGFTNKLFEKNESYTIGASLFNSFKNMGACKLIETVVEEKPKVTKIVKKKIAKKTTPVIENKAIEPASEEK